MSTVEYIGLAETLLVQICWRWLITEYCNHLNQVDIAVGGGGGWGGDQGESFAIITITLPPAATDLAGWLKWPITSQPYNQL